VYGCALKLREACLASLKMFLQRGACVMEALKRNLAWYARLRRGKRTISFVR